MNSSVTYCDICRKEIINYQMNLDLNRLEIVNVHKESDTLYVCLECSRWLKGEFVTDK